MSGELFPLIFVVTGLAFVGRGLRTLVMRRRFERTAARADGEVTDVRAIRSRSGSGSGSSSGTNTDFLPVVRFELPDGRTVEAEVADAHDFSAPEAGQSVEVFYDPGDPTHVRLELGASGMAKAGLHVAAGALFAIIGLSMLVA